MPDEKGASISTIISDDDSNGRAKAQHISNGGAIPPHIEEPTLWRIRHTENVSLHGQYITLQMHL
jgi:hypothetical protein